MYRQDVNQTIFEAIAGGVFQKAKNLDEIGNLMLGIEAAKYGFVKVDIQLASDEVLKKEKMYNL